MTVRDGGEVRDGRKGCCFHFCIAWVKGESPNKKNMRSVMAVVPRWRQSRMMAACRQADSTHER